MTSNILKKRVYLKNSDGTVKRIAWYKGTSQNDIINQIRLTFGIQKETKFGIYDDEGCILVISDNIPNDEVLTIKVESQSNHSKMTEENLLQLG